MKKIIFGSLLIAATIALGSCDNDNYGWDGSPMSSASETAQTVSFGDGSTTEVNPIDLATVTRNDVQVVRIKPPKVTDSAATTTYEINFLTTPSKTYTLTSDGYITTAELTAAVEDAYGKNPVMRTLPATVTAAVDKGGQVVTVTSGQFNVYVTPNAPVLSTTGYYIVGNCQGWDGSNTTYQYAFDGASPYDNPTITFTVPVPTDGSNLQFKVLNLAKVADWNDDYVLAGGSTGATVPADGSTTGKFVDKTNGNGGNLTVTAVAGAKYYQITLNLIEQTWTAKAMNDPELFMTGDHYSWGGTWVPFTPVHSTTDTFWKMIYLHAGEQFKFAPQAGWGNDFGDQAAIDDQAGAGITSEGGNLKATHAGWYLIVVVNGSARKVSILKPEVYLMGSTAPVNNWTIDTHNAFNVPATENGDFVSPAIAADGEVRMCVSFGGYDWWKTEFIVTRGGKLSYRGKGDDQGRVNVTTGQKVHINFASGTGSYQ